MPTQDNSPRSGNPAKQAEQALSQKQQREAAKQAKLAEYQRGLARRRRSKAAWWSVGSVAAVAVIGGIVASVVLTPKPATYEAALGIRIDGVQTFDNASQHTTDSVDYEQSPPAGGPHDNAWLTCAEYSEPQRDEQAVHSLEHGAVWLTYDPEQVTEADIDTLRSYMPGSYAILSPYPGMDTPIAVSGWNRQLKVDDASDERIPAFFQEYWKAADVPEPGASCTGITGPGRV